MKKIFFLFAFSIFTFSFCYAQTRHKIAVFAPLYLDSVFDASGNFRFDNTFPKTLIPGLEFYEGVQMAADSLSKMGAPLEVFIYDSKSKKANLNQQLNSPEMNGVEMIIAQAGGGDVKIFADAASKKKVPFISATLPNDAGITNNPYMVVLNSTLRSHCEAIYRYLQKYHSFDNIVLFRKNGTQENLIRDYFSEIRRTTSSPTLNIDVVELTPNFTPSLLAARLDSTKRNIIIAGSLEENFALRLAQTVNLFADSYPTTIVGMPTWENIKDLTKSEYRNLEILYTTPFYYTKTNNLLSSLADRFETVTSGRPTDMFYRGYETMLRFGLLLLDTKKDVASNLTRKGNYIFTQFDIQPVFLNKSAMTLDYFENKKLYVIKSFGGVKNVQN